MSLHTKNLRYFGVLLSILPFLSFGASASHAATSSVPMQLAQRAITSANTGDCSKGQSSLTIALSLIKNRPLGGSMTKTRELIDQADRAVSRCFAQRAASSPDTAEQEYIQQALIQAWGGDCEKAYKMLEQSRKVTTSSDTEDHVKESSAPVGGIVGQIYKRCAKRQDAAQPERDRTVVAGCPEMAVTVPVARYYGKFCNITVPARRDGHSYSIDTQQGINGGTTGVTVKVKGEFVCAMKTWRTRSTSCEVISPLETKMNLNCVDKSPAANLYKSIAGRCGEQEGIDYWNNDIARDGLAVATQTFKTALQKNCGNSSMEACNTALLCNEGYVYVTNTKACVLK